MLTDLKYNGTSSKSFFLADFPAERNRTRLLDFTLLMYVIKCRTTNTHHVAEAEKDP